MSYVFNFDITARGEVWEPRLTGPTVVHQIEPMIRSSVEVFHLHPPPPLQLTILSHDTLWTALYHDLLLILFHDSTYKVCAISMRVETHLELTILRLTASSTPAQNQNGAQQLDGQHRPSALADHAPSRRSSAAQVGYGGRPDGA